MVVAQARSSLYVVPPTWYASAVNQSSKVRCLIQCERLRFVHKAKLGAHSTTTEPCLLGCSPYWGGYTLEDFEPCRGRGRHSNGYTLPSPH